ncbi:hypothetical protein J5N97_012576 [Dioscorea zingiberensis]|uniref:SPARK domain-containing protein n=1 Tax=Dioscorea zingiberensis TaxID=325984 RepID=A0A9D5HI82_9LILI|nr:hypothetical protein J5N97_012576 [Dioscorea zingiberensis]
MDKFAAAYYFKGTVYHQLLILTIWICVSQDVASQNTELQPNSHVPGKFVLSDPPIGLFKPIEISPAVIPRNPYPVEPLPPMYPSFPSTYEPILTGKCPVNFSSISTIMEKTATDCSAPLAGLAGNVICCPQLNSLMHIFQGTYSTETSSLVLHQSAAEDCFSDIISILASRGANSTIPSLCSVKSSNLTGGSCPVKDITTFEKIINTSKLLDACNPVDRLKECCRPICQPAIMEAALHISLGGTSTLDSNITRSATGTDVVNDCKSVVYAWLARELLPEDANSAFRILSGCKVNKVCPLEFKEPSAKGGVMTDVYKLCDVDLKDFSLQAYGQQGCLLRSFPADVIFDNATGFSFTCDLSDNIAAPWPSSSSLQSVSLCAPEMSLPALPIAQNSGKSGNSKSGVAIVAFTILHLISSVML